MRSKIVGQALVITLETKLDDLKRAAKYAPKTLYLFAEDDEGHTAERFGVQVVNKPVTGGLNKYGATIGSCNADGFAQITLPLQGVEAEKRKGAVIDLYGKAMFDLAEVETNVAAALETIDTQIASVVEHMEVE